MNKRVRFFPTDTDETFDGTVIAETEYVYVVVPDENLMLESRWDKRRCDVLNDNSQNHPQHNSHQHPDNNS